MKHFVLIFVIGYYGFSTQFAHGQGVGARLGRALGTAVDDVTEPGVEERLIALRVDITILQEQMKMVYWHLNIDERDDPSQSLAHSGFGRRNEHEYGYGHNQTGTCTPEGDECFQGVWKDCCEGLFCKKNNNDPNDQAYGRPGLCTRKSHASLGGNTAAQNCVWAENCKNNGKCGLGTRKKGMCDIRDFKRNDPDYCGKCKYGWYSPPGWNTWCCEEDDWKRLKKGCTCPGQTAPECKCLDSASMKSGRVSRPVTSWYPNIESLFRYESEVPSGAIKNNVLSSNGPGSSIKLRADVTVQSFSDKTLRVKLDHPRFFSNGNEIPLLDAYGMFTREGSQQRNDLSEEVQAFKMHLQEPIMVHLKQGKIKSLGVSRNEPMSVTSLKKSLCSSLEKIFNDPRLQLIKKQAITTPFGTPAQLKKINITQKIGTGRNILCPRPKEVTWNLDGDIKHFPEDNIILEKTCDGSVPADEVRLGLEPQTSVTGWKAITGHIGRTFLGELVSVEDQPNTLKFADQLVSDLSVYTFYLSKAKGLRVHCDMYKIANARDMQGGCQYKFKWVSDS